VDSIAKNPFVRAYRCSHQLKRQSGISLYAELPRDARGPNEFRGNRTAKTGATLRDLAEGPSWSGSR